MNSMVNSGNRSNTDWLNELAQGNWVALSFDYIMMQKCTCAVRGVALIHSIVVFSELSSLGHHSGMHGIRR